MSGLARFARFVVAVFPPGVYVVYGVLWSLALEGTVGMLADGHWRPSAGTAVRAATVVLTLLYLRVVDEQKDLDYDRVHNPGRPLVTGAITVGELRIAMAVIVIALGAVNAPLSHSALAVLAFDLAYALFLVVLERLSTWIRDAQLVNLLVTYPVQLVLSGYVYLSTGQHLGWRAVPLLALFACVFLHFEFARKTSWTRTPGARMYSEIFGATGSAAVTVTLAAGAAVLMLGLFQPWRATGPGALVAWLPYAALVFPAVGLARFARRQVTAWPAKLGMGFIVACYACLTVQAVLW
jgi:hypothetical protein